MPDRVVKTTLVIDEHGAVRAVHGVGEESARTEKHLGKLDKSVKGVGKSFGGLKGMIAGGLGALGAGGLIFGLSSVASKTKEIALETERFHTQTGIGIQSSLYYDKALKARGLSSEQVGKAFGILSKNVKTAELQENKFGVAQVKAQGTGKLTTSQLGRQAEAFKELGINLGEFNRLTEQQKLEQITQAFEKMAPGMKKTRLERELFGRGGNQLSIVLEKGNLGLTHQIELVKKFFPTVKGGASAMKELVEKENESKLASEGLELALGEKLIPAMTAVMGWFSKVALEIEKGRGFWGGLGRDVEGVARAVKDVVGWLAKLGKAFNINIGHAGLGAALAAFAGIKIGKNVVHHPIGTAKKATGITKGLAKWTLSHPEFAPITAGILGGMAAGIPLNKRFPEGLFPGPSLGAAERALLGGLPRHAAGPAGHGHETFGGSPRRGETPGEAALIAKAIERLKPTHDEHQINVNIDSVKVAEAQIRNPRARRMLAESVAKYAHEMAARR